MPMRVRDLMSRMPITGSPESSVLEARALMAKERIRHLLVTDSNGELLGIVTDRDIRLALPSPATTLSIWEMNGLLAKLSVGDVMTKTLITVGPDRDAREAAWLMVEHKIGALPVLKDGRPVGIVTETDFLRAFAAGG
jgi:acetoin utilization protein AcuB